MGIATLEPRQWLSKHWVIAVILAVVAGDLASIFFAGWTDARFVEAALLFDFVVLLPCLYWWCYRSKGRAAIVQAVALACFGAWCMGKLVPVEHRHLVDWVGRLRYVGLAALLLLEIKLGVMVYKAVVFSGQSKQDAQRTFESEGMPRWLATFMAFEASLWRRLWLFVQRIFSRNTP